MSSEHRRGPRHWAVAGIQQSLPLKGCSMQFGFGFGSDPESLARTLFFCGAVMLAPIGSIAATVERDLGENEFGGEAALGEMGGDSLLRRFR